MKKVIPCKSKVLKRIMKFWACWKKYKTKTKENNLRTWRLRKQLRKINIWKNNEETIYNETRSSETHKEHEPFQRKDHKKGQKYSKNLQLISHLIIVNAIANINHRRNRIRLWLSWKKMGRRRIIRMVLMRRCSKISPRKD